MDSFHLSKNLKGGLATDLVHSGATDWTLTFHSGLTVFHGDFNC